MAASRNKVAYAVDAALQDLGKLDDPTEDFELRFETEAKEEGEPQPTPAQDEPTSEESPAQEEPAENPYLDELRALRTELLAHQNHQAQQIEALRKPAPAPAQDTTPLAEPDPTFYLTDVHLKQFQDRIGQLEQTGNQFRTIASQLARQQEQSAFDAAWNKVQSEYPDVGEFIPVANREAALNAVFQKEAYGQRWEDEIKKVYKQAAFDRYHSQANELALKRAEKEKQEKEKTAAITTASVVPAGGHPYQAPATKRPLRDSRYEFASKEILRDLQALGG